MKNYSIIKIVFVILISVFFMSCNQEELQNQNEAAFIDLMKSQIEANDAMISKIFTRSKSRQEKDDKSIYIQALNVQITRKKALEQFFLSGLESIDSILIKQYEIALKTPPKVIYNQDSLTEYTNLISEDIGKIKYRDIHQNKTQKIVWISQLLVVEAWLLEYYENQMSYSFASPARSDTFSDDNPQVDELYEIFIPSIPSQNGGIHLGKYYTIINSFTFQIDGVETKIVYEIKRIEDAGILRFALPKKGQYVIWGSSRVRYDHDERLSKSNKIAIHSFEVK